MVTDQMLASRYAKAAEPADFLLAFENRERYIAQSAATKTGRPAPLPSRGFLSRELRPPK